MLFSVPLEKLQKEQRRTFFLNLFRRIFLRDWGTKLIALIVTLALWFIVTGQRTSITTRLKSIPLNLRISNEMEITNSPTQEVEITVSGDKQKIDRLNQRDLVVSVDLSNTSGGDRAVDLNPQNVNLELPTGIKLESIQPNKIAVKLERVFEREVEVKPEFEGNLPDGFEIYSKTVLPARVKVRGPESFIKSLDSISTEKISIDDRKENFTIRQLGLNLVNPKITALDSIVDVSLIIGKKRPEKSLTLDVKYESETKTLTLVLLAPREILDELKPEELPISLVKDEKNKLKPILPPDLANKIEIKSYKVIS